MPKFSLLKEIQQYCQGKLFFMISSQGVSFSHKKWCCAVGANLDTFLARISLIATPTQKISGMSLIEQGDTAHRLNQISVQPEPSPVIHPNGGFLLDTLTLTLETDMGLPMRKSLVWILAQNQTRIHPLTLSCLYKIICLRVEKISCAFEGKADYKEK